ncbi:unnamed protein product [Paramecium octaurelia]|uniref:Uncharacterized protein n=1 Tax=Paramecium octaurelia TaxID=43137 RepID=A0A8S1SVG5_PAROT|nr:unnamed protein product [Paramecium octaurelia]
MRSSLALRLRNSIDNTHIQYDNKYSVHVNTQHPAISPRKSVDKTTIHQIYKVTQPHQIKHKTTKLGRDSLGYNVRYNNSVDVSLEELKKIKTLEKSLYCIQENRQRGDNKIINEKVLKEVLTLSKSAITQINNRKDILSLYQIRNNHLNIITRIKSRFQYYQSYLKILMPNKTTLASKNVWKTQIKLRAVVIKSIHNLQKEFQIYYYQILVIQKKSLKTRTKRTKGKQLFKVKYLKTFLIFQKTTDYNLSVQNTLSNIIYAKNLQSLNQEQILIFFHKIEQILEIQKPKDHLTQEQNTEQFLILQQNLILNFSVIQMQSDIQSANKIILNLLSEMIMKIPFKYSMRQTINEQIQRLEMVFDLPMFRLLGQVQIYYKQRQPQPKKIQNSNLEETRLTVYCLQAIRNFLICTFNITPGFKNIQTKFLNLKFRSSQPT